MMKVAILSSGNGTNARRIMELAAEGKLPHVEIAGLISDRRDAPALEVARKFGTKPIFLDAGAGGARFSEAGAKFYIENLNFICAELVVLAGFMRIIPKPVIDAFPNRVINLHPSLLPAFKASRNAIEDAWNFGVKVSGCTVHFVNEKLDDGKIIAQKAVEIAPDDTLESFEAKMHAAEHSLLPFVVEDIAAGKIR